MIAIRELTKTYANGVRALDAVSLDIPRGMFGLLGPNGAGKSSLMRTLATLQQADAGSATMDDGAGGSIDMLREPARVRRQLGYLPQDFGVYPKVGAEDLLDHFAVLKGLTARGQRKEVDKTELGEYQARFNVLSSRLMGGRPMVHVFAESDPGEGFAPVEAGLEDDNRVQEATARRRADGKYEVTLKLHVGKAYADGKGKETAAPMDEMVEVGVFADGPSGKERDEKVLYLQRHRITGSGNITVVVDGKPDAAGIDPYNTLIDKVSSDNRRKVALQ